MNNQANTPTGPKTPDGPNPNASTPGGPADNTAATTPPVANDELVENLFDQLNKSAVALIA